jgi:hypothetical protein
MRRARTCPWIRIRPYRVLLRGQGVFFAARSSADCITNTSGFDLRQAHGVMAFTDDGIENLKELIAIHKDTPSIIEKRRQALAAMMKPKTEESDEI